MRYSCLENPMDREAWWATVHGVTKSRTQLSNFTFTFFPLVRSLGSLQVFPFGFGFCCFHEALGTLCDGEPTCISSCCFGLASWRGSCLVRGSLTHTAIQEACTRQSPGRWGPTDPAGSNSPLTSTWKNPAMQAAQVRSLVGKIPWRIPWTEEPAGLQSMSSQNQTQLSD